MKASVTPVAFLLLACGSAADVTASDGGGSTLDAAASDGRSAVEADGGGLRDGSSEGGVVVEAGACAIPRVAGVQHVTCSGVALTIAAPVACVSQPCGIILDIHGLSMNAEVEDANTRLRANGNAAGYVVVQPDAPQSSSLGPTWFDSDDAAVWSAFTSVRGAFATDAKRVHVTGFSQGGYMTWRLICAHADVLASAAPGAAGQAGCPAGNFNGSCSFAGADKPSSPIDVLFVAGTKDAIVPAWCSAPQVASVVAAWGGQKQKIAGDITYERDRYVGNAGNTFEVLTHAYATDPFGPLATNQGHCMPGADAHTGTVWDALGCTAPNAFVWGQEVLAFFIAHPRK